VRRQVAAKTFIQSTIATLGGRLQELILPVPKDQETKLKIEREVEIMLTERARHRHRLNQLRNSDFMKELPVTEPP
jgi:hypothetical protein